MRYKDTTQQGFYLFIFHLVYLSEFLIWKVDPHTKKCGHPWCRLFVISQHNRALQFVCFYSLKQHAKMQQYMSVPM